MEGFKFPNKESGSERNPEKEEFLREVYMDNEYIVPENVDTMLSNAADELLEDYPQKFVFLTLVGGLANGSYEYRRRYTKHKVADVDFYFGGLGAGPEDLSSMSDRVRAYSYREGFTLDPALNGKNPENYLNLSNIDHYIDEEKYDLLALPFNCVYGDYIAARKAVLDAVISRENSQEIWDKIAEYHIQSLSLHHGLIEDDVQAAVMNEYYPQKIEKFQLLETPEEYLETLDAPLLDNNS